MFMNQIISDLSIALVPSCSISFYSTGIKAEIKDALICFNDLV